MISRIRETIRVLLNAPNALRMRLQEIKAQLDRMEDKLSRIEDGLEAQGILKKETKLKQRNLNPEKLDLNHTFDYIYLHGLWNEDPNTPSGTGSAGAWAVGWVALVKDFVAKHDVHSITDIGCGDFNVGSQICAAVEKYNALDVSTEIIRINKERYSSLGQVNFRQANACEDALPVADLATIRQVLQHLTNAQIEAILKNVAGAGFKYLLVAEHQPKDDKLVKPNLDMQSQSTKIRLGFGSGIYLDQPPFSRPVRQVAQFDGEGGQLTIYLWEFAKDAASQK
jgi:2-polyprenyl-3-methyl-5-hydroxy-6-metoxy-1,4-benzoquinol methylase